jgi:CubicO group peptidase (beta-lactamase class C family)
MKYLPIIPIAIFFACQTSPTVNYIGDLEINVPVSESLEKKTPNSYKMTLDSGTFIYGYVDQISVDVVVKLSDEEDKMIGNFDGPGRGHEPFSFEISKTGTYRLDVEPFKEESGDYSITLVGVEPIATDPEKRVDQLLTFYTGNVPGAVVGIMKEGELTFGKAVGKANLRYDIDFQLNTPTNIGSVTKQFTAFSILLLEKEGKLSIDDDVRKYIPELPGLGQTITIKHLMNHTNGLREVYNLMPITGWKGEDVLLREEILRILQNQKELQAPPGEKFNYNNSAFILLAEIVERVTEQKFPKWVKENVFDPLDMNDSYVRRDPAQIIPNAAMGYSSGEYGIVESGDLYAGYGAGGIYTTPIDLAKWINNLNKHELGGQELIDKLLTPGILNSGDTMSYALGIGVGEYKGLENYSHGGADIAHRAMLIYFPSINSGVVTLSNNATFPGSIAWKLADVFFEEYLEQEETEADPEKINISEKILSKYAGKYKMESIGLVIEYKLEDGALVAYPTGQSSLKLNPTSDTSFTYEGIKASIVFKSIENDKSNSAIHTQGGQDITLNRLASYDPSLSELKEFTGRYFSDEVETFYNIVLKDSILVAEHRNLKDIKLSPTEEDTFSGDIYFMGEVAFQRNDGKLVVGFTVSNGRTEGIVFERN